MIERGMNVMTASSGEEVIELCGNNRFDIFIVDLGLPGMSGLDLASHIKNIDKEAGIILTSGWELNESISSLMSRGVDVFLAKPFQSEEILEAITNLLDSDAEAGNK
jgi:two-component system competent response regulator ComA